MRFEILAADQMLGQRFNPFGLNASNRASKPAAGFDQFPGDKPLRALGSQCRARPDHQTVSASAHKIAVGILAADVGQQSRHQRAVSGGEVVMAGCCGRWCFDGRLSGVLLLLVVGFCGRVF